MSPRTGSCGSVCAPCPEVPPIAARARMLPNPAFQNLAIGRRLFRRFAVVSARGALARRIAGREHERGDVDFFRRWLESWLPQVPGRNTLARREGLTRLLHYGRVEMDNSPVECPIRPGALGRKTHLFMASHGLQSREVFCVAIRRWLAPLRSSCAGDSETEGGQGRWPDQDWVLSAYPSPSAPR